MSFAKTSIVAKQRNHARRKQRTNAMIKATSSRPRVIVNKSNKFNYVQIVDLEGKIIIAGSDKAITAANKTERAQKLGADLGAKAIKAGVKEVAFDRNGHVYHGRIKGIADGLREAGLQF